MGNTTPSPNMPRPPAACLHTCLVHLLPLPFRIPVTLNRTPRCPSPPGTYAKVPGSSAPAVSPVSRGCTVGPPFPASLGGADVLDRDSLQRSNILKKKIPYICLSHLPRIPAFPTFLPASHPVSYSCLNDNPPSASLVCARTFSNHSLTPCATASLLPPAICSVSFLSSFLFLSHFIYTFHL